MSRPLPAYLKRFVVKRRRPLPAYLVRLAFPVDIDRCCSACGAADKSHRSRPGDFGRPRLPPCWRIYPNVNGEAGGPLEEVGLA